MPSSHNQQLEHITGLALEDLSRRHEAREKGIRVGRQVIRLSANAIRAVHRQEFQEAQRLLDQASVLLTQAKEILDAFPNIYYAGYLADARKEYCEGRITLALISSGTLPLPEELDVEIAAYLNGMGEAVGEMRRYILDSLKSNKVQQCEAPLEIMDEIYTLLVSMDFPEALTGGLRRTTDMVRGVLERTRGDLTMALRQRQLERKLTSFDKHITSG